MGVLTARGINAQVAFIQLFGPVFNLESSGQKKLILNESLEI